MATGKILVLSDGKAGHENQSRALVRGLGGEAHICRVAFKSPFHKALSYLLDRVGILTGSLFSRFAEDLDMSEFSAVVGTGSGTFYAVKTVAGKNGLKSVAMLYPRGYRLGGFDLVLSPAFDRPRKLPNVVEIPANLVAVDEEFYARGTEEFLKRHQPCKPAVAVVVGGPNKCSSMTGDWMRRQLEKIFAENPGCEFWVTSSRRTPPEVEKEIDSFPFDYKLIFSRDKFNPIPAFVVKAEKIYVSAESTGMLSEACTYGTAHVEVMDNLNGGDHKFRRFVDALRRDGYVGGRRKVALSPFFDSVKARLGLG